MTRAHSIFTVHRMENDPRLARSSLLHCEDQQPNLSLISRAIETYRTAEYRLIDDDSFIHSVLDVPVRMHTRTGMHGLLIYLLDIWYRTVDVLVVFGSRARTNYGNSMGQKQRPRV